MTAIESAFAQLWTRLVTVDPSFAVGLAVAVFAGVQTYWMRRRYSAARSALMNQTVGPAWLARRSLEQDARDIDTDGFVDHEKSWRGDRGRIDRIETQAREVLRLSADVGGTFKDKGRRVFAAWIGYADAMQVWGQGKLTYSEEEVVERLFAAIAALEEIHPREASEPDVPTLEDVRAKLVQDGHGVRTSAEDPQ